MLNDDKVLAYVQGRLTPEERGAFEEVLAQDADLRAEVSAMQAAREVLAQEPQDIPSDGWQRLSEAIDAPVLTPANDNAPIRLSLLQAAAVALVAVLGWQAIDATLLAPDTANYTTASANSSEPSIQITFTPSVPLSDVTTILADLDGTIVNGPGALGLYTISFTDVAARDAAYDVLNTRPEIAADLIKK